MKNMTLWVLGTGGTIAGTVDPTTQSHPNAHGSNDLHMPYTAAQKGIASLLMQSNIQLPPNWHLQSHQIMQTDSKDMSWQGWQALILAVHNIQVAPEDGAIVVTHGTDTLEETATLFQWWMTHQGWTKSITLTCAMRPSDHPQPDGPANLAHAAKWAIQTSDRAGVWVVAAQQVLSAEQVQKDHPLDTKAMVARDGTPAACWNDTHAQWIPARPFVEESPQTKRRQSINAEFGLPAWPAQPPWVEIVRSGACVDATLLHLLLQAGVEGLILECTGNGTWNTALDSGLSEAVERQVCVAWVSRCAHGAPKNSAHPKEWADYSQWSASKARVWLMLNLAFKDSMRRKHEP